MNPSDLCAVVLCGGQGTRIAGVSDHLPKPMLPIGDRPIVWHILQGYAAFGVRRFVLCLGHKKEAFLDYFLNYHARAASVTVSLGSGRVVPHAAPAEDWEVTLLDTGEHTPTAARVRRALPHVGERFFLTYGDGLSDVDHGAVLAAHVASGRAATLTAVAPPGRFGELELSGEGVRGFAEKPAGTWINGGFMAMERRFARFLDDGMLEAGPLPRAAAAGELGVYRHGGFWQCMDTAADHKRLQTLWTSGAAPWAVRAREAA